MEITIIDKYLAKILGDIKEDNPKIISPFIAYYLEDKSKYPLLNTTKCNKKHNWIDKDEDFLLGDSGGVLMKEDFIFINTNVFSEVAEDFMASGEDDTTRIYLDAPYLSNEYIKFWDRELIRRREGMTAKCKLYHKDIQAYLEAPTKEIAESYLYDLHITGDHYNYLNYGRIERTPNDEERAELDRRGLFKQTTIEAFPRFWDGDYWNFKLDLLIQLNSKNLCKGKARRKGFSYKRGSQAANTVNLYKKTTVTLAAYDSAYLTDKGATTSMAKLNLDWYETHTDWMRGYLSESIDDIVLGYKESSDGHKHKGWLSGIYSVACQRNESAAIGKKALELDLEEAGKFPNIENVLNVTLSNLEAGSNKIGTIRAYGTAGTKEGNWLGFSKIFYNPNMYNMLALENIYDKNARNRTCGYFFPQILNYEPFIDEHGNSRLIDAYYDDLTVKEVMRKNLKGVNLIVSIGQRANSPEEAFNSSSENIFTSYELDNHILQLEHDDDYKFYKDGQLVLKDGKIEFISNTILKETERIHEFIQTIGIVKGDDVAGCWREYYSPYYLTDGTLDQNVGIVYDPYGVDKNKEDLELYHSLGCIQVWSLPGYKGPCGGDKLLAEFAGRRNTMEEIDRILWYTCMRWGVKALVESNRGEAIANFGKWGVLKLLMRDPTSIIETGMLAANAGYGISIKNDIDKLEYIRELYEILYTPISSTEHSLTIYKLSYIYSTIFLKELQSFNNKGNFDRLSTALLYTIYRKANSRKKQVGSDKDTTSKNTTHKRITNLLHGQN